MSEEIKDIASPKLSAVVEAEVHMSADATGLNRVLGEVGNHMGYLLAPMAEIAQGGSVAQAAWSGMKMVMQDKLLGPLALVSPLAMMASQGLRNIVAETNAIGRGLEQITKLQVLEGQFAPLLKSAEAAKQKVAELQKFADKTPFRLEEVGAGAKQLEVLTRGAYSSEGAMKTVGDAAALAGVSFEDMSHTVGQLYDGLKSGRSVGEVTARLQDLGVVSGTTRNRIEQLQQSGADAGAIFSETWKTVLSDMQRADGQMGVLAKSLGGLKSTLADKQAANSAAFASAFTPLESSGLNRSAKEAEALRPFHAEWGRQAAFGEETRDKVKDKISENVFQTKGFGELAKQAVATAYWFTRLAQATAMLVAGIKISGWVSQAGGIEAVFGKAKGLTTLGMREDAGALASKAWKGAGQYAENLRATASSKLVGLGANVKDWGAAEAILRSTDGAGHAERSALAAKLTGKGDEAGIKSALKDVVPLARDQRQRAVTPELRDDFYAALGVGRDKSTGAHPDLTPEGLKNVTPKQRAKAAATYGVSAKDFEEAAMGVGKFNKAAEFVPSTLGLVAKAGHGAITVIKELVLTMALPTLILTGIAAIVGGISSYVGELSDARKEASDTAKATDALGDSLRRAASDAQTAEQRAEVYKKALDGLADAKRRVADIKGEDTHWYDNGAARAIKLRGAERNVMVAEDTRDHVRATAGASGLSVAEQKRFLESIELERQLGEASKDRIESQLSGEDRVASAAERAEAATRRRIAAEAEHAAMLKTTTSNEYKEADERVQAAREAHDAPLPGADASPEKQEAGRKARRDAVEELAQAEAAKRALLQGSGSSQLNRDAAIGEQGEISAHLDDQLRNGNSMNEEQVREQLKAELKAHQSTEDDSHEGYEKTQELQARIADVRGVMAEDARSKTPQFRVSLTPEKRAVLEQQKAESDSKLQELQQAKDKEVARLDPIAARNEEMQRKEAHAAAVASGAGESTASKNARLDQEMQNKLASLRENYAKERAAAGASPSAISAEMNGPEFSAKEQKIKTDRLDEKAADMQAKRSELLALAPVARSLNHTSDTEIAKEGYGSAQEQAEDKAAAKEKANGTMGGEPEKKAAEDKEYARRVRARVQDAQAKAGVYGNVAQIDTQLGGIANEREQAGRDARGQSAEGAERSLARGSGTATAQSDRFLASLNVRGNSYRVAEDQVAIDTARREAADAQEKHRLASDASITPAALQGMSADVSTKIAIAPPEALDSLRKQQAQITAAIAARSNPGMVLDLGLDAQNKANAIPRAERAKTQNDEDARLATAEAVRGSQLSGIRRLEGRAQSRGERDTLRAQGDKIEDESNYAKAKVEARGLGLSEEGQEKYAQLQKGKAGVDRDIERNTTPVIASDLARIGGASGEVAGGDIPRQQLETLKQIVSALGALGKNESGVAGPSRINPMNTEFPQ